MPQFAINLESNIESLSTKILQKIKDLKQIEKEFDTLKEQFTELSFSLPTNVDEFQKILTVCPDFIEILAKNTDQWRTILMKLIMTSN